MPSKTGAMTLAEPLFKASARAGLRTAAASIRRCVRALLKKTPDTFLRFGHAMHEAIVYANAHLSDTTDLVAQYTKVDPAIIAKSTRTTDSEYLSGADIQPVIDFAVRCGLVDKAVDGDLLVGAAARRPAR